jgi:enoyl-CoA hydratase/carnithine racemase
MLLTGAPLGAQRAYALGLVNRVVPAAQLDAAVQQYVDVLCQLSPRVLALGKRAFYDELWLDEAAAYRQATAVISQNAVEPDAQEGIAAFLEKRAPQWWGNGRNETT